MIHAMIKSIFIFLIKVYQFLISPFLGKNCRFDPHCSSYAIIAFESHGILKGVILTIKRISRCHPWGKSGYDPVPD